MEKKTVKKRTKNYCVDIIQLQKFKKNHYKIILKQ